MTRRALTKQSRSAIATGAIATGAASLGSLALGAMALGAMAVGALAIGRLSVGRARLRRVEIGELTVGKLDVGAIGTPGGVTAVARVRAAPGSGDAFEQFLIDQLAASDASAMFCQARRSQTDPDLFLLSESFIDAAADAPAPRLGAPLRQAADRGLVAAAPSVEADLYRTI